MVKYIKIHWVLGIIALINILQSYCTELHPDEAYYWVLSQKVAWSYYDHPPMVALWIRCGHTLLHNELGVRLAWVVAHCATLWLAYRLIFDKNPQYATQFYVASAALPVLQMYGWIATPDMPLMLSGLVFLWCYKQYLYQYSLKNAALVGVAMGIMAYCKYHGVVIILCAVMANISILKQKYTYLAVFMAILMIFPHLFWQYTHDFPSFKYHLAQRHEGFKIKYVLEYIGNQLLVFNPILIIGGVAYFYKQKNIKKIWQPNTDFQRTLLFISVGFLVFFLVNSVRGRIEAHWTAFATLTALMYFFEKIITSNQTTKSNIWYYAVGISIGIFLILRVLLIIDILPNKQIKRLFFDKNRYAALHQVAKNKPVLFVDSYQDAAKYAFYYDQKSFSLNTQLRRQNHYDFINYETELRHRPAIIAQAPNEWGLLEGSTTPDSNFRYLVLDSLNIYPKLQIETINDIHTLKPPPYINILQVKITNPYNYSIQLTPDFLPNITLWQMHIGAMRDVPLGLTINTLAPNTTVITTAKLVVFDEIIRNKTYNYTLGFKPKYCIALCASKVNVVAIE